MIEGAQKDRQTASADFEMVRRDLLDGVRIKEIRHIITRNSVTTEAVRNDWDVIDRPIQQALHVAIRVGAITDWNLHRRQTDHIFCVRGALKVVLFDDRDGSPTRGRINELFLSDRRPQLIVIPVGVWHAVANLWHEDSIFMNFFDRMYDHEDPDEWRLPLNTDQIPYRF